VDGFTLECVVLITQQGASTAAESTAMQQYQQLPDQLQQ
jgi:hypothetical protein